MTTTTRTTTGRRTTGLRLTPRWRRIMLTAHILASVSLVGLTVALSGLGIAGWSGADPRGVYPATAFIEEVMIAPLVLAALVTGVLQVALSPWTYRHTWLLVKVCVTMVLVVSVFLVFQPSLSAAADAALAGEALSPAQRAPMAIAPILATVLLGLNVALSVYKPGRARGRRS